MPVRPTEPSNGLGRKEPGRFCVPTPTPGKDTLPESRLCVTVVSCLQGRRGLAY